MAPTNKTIIAIRRDLADSADPAVLASITRLVPGTNAIGVSVPRLRELAAEWHRTLRELSIDELCGLVDGLWDRGVREECLVGVFLLGKRGKKVATVPWARIAPWARRLDNWETCDQLASQVSGPVVAGDLGLVGELESFARQPDQWQRRFAVATASELNHKSRHHPTETYALCSLLLQDPEPKVRIAVGWALREAGKKDPDGLAGYLRSVRTSAHKQVIREASKSLPETVRAELSI